MTASVPIRDIVVDLQSSQLNRRETVASLPLGLRDSLAYYEPNTGEFGSVSAFDGSQMGGNDYTRHSGSLDQSNHAVLIVDNEGRVRRKNFLASELIADGHLFRVQQGVLLPLSDGDLSYWSRQIGELLRTRRPRIAIVGGLYCPVAVGLRLRDQGLIEVHVETGLKLREEVLQLFCDSTGITNSERDVLRWVLIGLKPKAIAKIRSRSEATVRSHVKNALAKSGCSSVPELISMVSRLPDFV